MHVQEHSTFREGLATGLIGALIVAAWGMAGYLWRRHPRLGQSLEAAPLGSEVPGPPHPRAGPPAA